MPLITDWQAVTVAGERMRRRELVAADLSSLPFAQVERVGVETDHPAMPLVRVAVDPAKGDRAGIPFSRRTVSLDAPPGAEPVGVPAIEVQPGPGRIVRLELHPEGPILVVVDKFAF